MTTSENAVTAGLATAAALTSAFVAAIGVDWQMLFFATVAAFIGSGVDKHGGGAIRACLMFAASVVLAAKTGAVAGDWLGSIGNIKQHQIAEGVAAVVGLFFYPLLQRGRAVIATAQIPGVEK